MKRKGKRDVDAEKETEKNNRILEKRKFQSNAVCL